MAAFLHVDLEQVTHVVKRGSRLAQVALLLDRGRFGIALNHYKTAQHGAVFTGDIMPCRLAEMAAERNSAILLSGCQQNAPAVFRHPHIVEFSPTFWVH